MLAEIRYRLLLRRALSRIHTFHQTFELIDNNKLFENNLVFVSGDADLPAGFLF